MRRSRSSLLPVAFAFAVALPACGSKAEGDGLDMLDPALPHYGKTYAEWAADWVSYTYSASPPDCINPILDTTGAHCQSHQDPESPVFFLVGNYGGVSERDECSVPKGKALFFPILGIWGDNAGVPEEMRGSDGDLMSFAESNFDTFVRTSLRLTVDGEPLTGLERGGIRSAPYVVHLEAGNNQYVCAGIDGVAGDFPGYFSGYWILLPPLPAGHHVIEFGGNSTSSTPSADVAIDVSYTFDLN